MTNATRSMRPETAAQLADLFRWATSEHSPLEIRGGGTKAEIGQPGRQGAVVDMRAFADVIDYDPGELVMTIGAGARLADVEKLLRDNGQMLAFDPIDHGPLFGKPAGEATIGGVIAANIAGSRRLSAGCARDHMLGFEGVSGRGELFKAGGRVVKNVTGYDLARLMVGSWGRLVALTTVSLKVLPRPETEASVLIEGLSDADAVSLMNRAMGWPLEVAAAAHLPAGLAASATGTILRIEGFGPSVATRAAEVAGRCGGKTQMIEAGQSAALWQAIRDVAPLPQGDTLWRVTLPGVSGSAIGAALEGSDARHYYDWAGGLVWVSAPGGVDVRSVAEQAGGQAVLVRATETVRASISSFHPERLGVAALRNRVKAGFDPAGILDPYRFGPAGGGNAH